MSMYSRKFLGALAVGILMSAGARADDSGFYLGAAVGEATQSSGEFDGSDTSFKLLAGYSFNRYFAAEAGFVDAGTQKDSIRALDVKTSAEGVVAAVLAKLPLGKVVTPYVKLGYVFYDSTTTASAGGMQVSESFSDEDPLYSVGCEFRIGEHFRLRAEYERVDVPDTDFDIVSAVATYQF
jgi:hypothetical protein